MKVALFYGRTGLEVDFPLPVDVLRSKEAPGVPEEAEAIRAALRNPLGSAPLASRVKPGDRVVVAHSDITRPTPNARLLPPLLAELEEAGVRRQDITLLNALGTHRPQTPAELRSMLGDFIVENYTCLQHDACDDAGLVSLGVTSFGHPVRLSRRLLDADFKILTGFIEPHFFAGFSGGPKGVLPALAGAESVLSNHGYAMIAHPQATWGVTHGNPIWEEMLEMALKVTPAFLLNVTLNSRRQISGVFAGDLQQAHARGCEFVRRHAMLSVEQPYDVVVTTNSGYPLDQNLYQSVKGMSAAARAVRPGGAILMVSACEDGLPDHGQYTALLRQGGSPGGVLEMVSQPGFSVPDQWEVQVQAMVQQKAQVWVYSQGLSDDQLRAALFNPCQDVAAQTAALAKQFGPRVCVLPEGPLSIPTLG
jgi:lactate racemase